MIKEFGEFSAEELTGGVPFGHMSSGMWYDPRRDIAWLVLCEGVSTQPASVWLGEDDRIQAAVQLDENGKLLSVAIGEASRHVPPYVVLAPGNAFQLRVAVSHERDALQVLLGDAATSTSFSALSMTSDSQEGFVRFVRDSSQLLIAVVVEPVSKLAHPSIVPWMES